jgi:hypothetical protein
MEPIRGTTSVVLPWGHRQCTTAVGPQRRIPSGRPLQDPLCGTSPGEPSGKTLQVDPLSGTASWRTYSGAPHVNSLSVPLSEVHLMGSPCRDHLKGTPNGAFRRTTAGGPPSGCPNRCDPSGGHHPGDPQRTPQRDSLIWNPSREPIQ